MAPIISRAPARPCKNRTTRRSSLQKCTIAERGATAPFENLGGRCSVGAHIFRAPARPFGAEWGGAAHRKNRTTRRSSLQYHRRLRPAIVTSKRRAASAGFAGGSDAATTTVTQAQFARSQKAVDLTSTDSQNLFAQIGICFASIAPVWRQPVCKHGLEPLAASLLVGFPNPLDHSRFGLFIDRRRPFARIQIPRQKIIKK